MIALDVEKGNTGPMSVTQNIMLMVTQFLPSQETGAGGRDRTSQTTKEIRTLVFGW